MDGLARLALFFVSVVVASLGVTASLRAVDRGQFESVSPEVRAWFKSVTAPNGMPCCDISDGHRTDYDMREGAYWVPIEGEWMRVPDRAVIRDAGNPVGDAVVWYVRRHDAIVISCFVPGSGA
jgi:hypothetical protein